MLPFVSLVKKTLLITFNVFFSLMTTCNCGHNKIHSSRTSVWQSEKDNIMIFHIMLFV